MRDGEVYDGILRIGFEVFSFTPCGSGEAWMVSGNRKNDDTIAKLVEDYEALKQKEYDDVFVRLRGTPSKEGQYGHMNMYRRAFYLKEIIKIRRRGSMDCN